MLRSRDFFLSFLLILLINSLDLYSQPSFTRHNIHTDLRGAYWVYAKDIDKDGDLDLVTAAFDGIDWWKNSSGQSFSKNFLGPLQGSWGAYAEDVNGDGDIDILGCSPAVDQVALWLNNGSQNFSKTTVDAQGQDPETVFAIDLDEDGDTDIMAAQWVDDELAWYENKGSNNFTKHVLDGNVPGAHSISAGDFDRDGDNDIVGCGSQKTNWYKNNGSGSFTRISLSSSGGWCVNVADIDSDGDVDILRTQRDNGDVDWFKNNGSGGFSENNIESGYGECWSVSAGDIDGDGDVDVAGAGFGAGNIMVWLNKGGGSFGSGIVVDHVNRPRAVSVGDFDKDGDADISAAIRDDRDLVWYEVDGTPNLPASIAVLDPNGGEFLTAGNSFSISWSSSGSFGDVTIELSDDNGASWSTIKSGTNNDGNYSWTIPNISSSQCLIRIYDADDGTPFDVSDAVFEIGNSGGGGGNPIVFTPTDDARVKASRAGNNYGDRDKLYVENGEFTSFLKFDITGLSTGIQTAVLRLYVENASEDGGSIYLVSESYSGSNTPWDEDNLTYDNAPDFTGAVLDQIGQVQVGNVVEFDITSAVTGNGIYSFGLKSGSTDKVEYSSKEGTSAPQVILQVSSSPGQHSLAVSTQGSGNVTLNPAGGTYEQGTVVELNAAAMPGWTFSGWGGDLNGTGNPANITVDSDKNVVATFQQAGGGANQFTFTPSDDARVKASRAGNNYGDRDKLYVENGTFKSFLKFDVTGLSGGVQSAVLRLFVENASEDGGKIYLAPNTYAGSSTSWHESGLTYNNAPVTGGSALDQVGPVGTGAVVEFDVSAVVSGNGTYSFGIESDSGDKVEYSSKEGIVSPELVVQAGSGGGDPIQYDLTVNVQGSGSVLLTPAGGTYDEGTAVELSPVAASGWTFTGWSGDLNGTDDPANITMNADKTVVAAFTENSSGGGQVVFTPTDDARVKASRASNNYGDRDKLYVEKGEFESFLKFDVTGLAGGVQNAVLRLYVQNASNDGGKVYLTSNTYSGSNSLWNESGITDNNSPVISGSALDQAGSVGIGEIVAFDVTSAVSGNGVYSFGIQSESANKVEYSSKEGVASPELVIQPGSGGGDPIQYDLIVSTSGSGNVSPSPGGGTYAADSEVTLTATAASGWTFTGWSGDLSGSTNPSSITMDENKNVTATFVETAVPQYSLAVSTQGSGSVTLNPAGGIYAEGTVIELAAVAASGWTFSGWGGDLQGAGNPANITMESDKNVSVSFAQNGGGSSPVTFLPTDDARVKESRFDSNYGDRDKLYVEEDEFTSFLKFDVTGLSEGVQRALLRLYVVGASEDGGKIYSVSNVYSGSNSPWRESAITYANAPGISGSALDQTGTVRVGEIAEFDVTDAVSGNGIYSFGLRSNSTDKAEYASSEGVVSPELVIQQGDAVSTQHVLTINTQGSGSVALNPDGGTYAAGTVVQLTATPDQGWQFGGWTGSIGSSSSTVNITMNSDYDVTATFLQALSVQKFEAPEAEQAIPEVFDMSSAYPNPFNAETTIQYQLPSAVRVQISVYNLKGQLVRRLVDEAQTTGFKKIKWDGHEQGGLMVSSGLYFVRFKAAGHKFVRSVTLQK